jgi:hypothetical protein
MADFNQSPSDQLSIALSLSSVAVSASGDPVWELPSWSAQSANSIAIALGDSGGSLASYPSEGQRWPWFPGALPTLVPDTGNDFNIWYF